MSPGLQEVIDLRGQEPSSWTEIDNIQRAVSEQERRQSLEDVICAACLLDTSGPFPFVSGKLTAELFTHDFGPCDGLLRGVWKGFAEFLGQRIPHDG